MQTTLESTNQIAGISILAEQGSTFKSHPKTQIRHLFI